jgi:hypothetical protein
MMLRAVVLAVLAGLAIGVIAADAGLMIGRHVAQAQVTRQYAAQHHGPEVAAT